MLFRKIAAEAPKTELIAIFKLPIVWRLLLDGIVRQVDPVILERTRIRRVDTRASPDVAFSEQQCVHILSDEHPHANIEFATMDQQWIFYVLLNNELIAFYQFRGPFSCKNQVFAMLLRFLLQGIFILLILFWVAGRWQFIDRFLAVWLQLLSWAQPCLRLLILEGAATADRILPPKEVFLYQALDLADRVDNMNALSAVQAYRLQYPQIVQFVSKLIAFALY